MVEEVYGDDILLNAIHYSESVQFDNEIENFKRKYFSLFEDQITQQKNGMEAEQSHEVYQAFLEYQDLIETLFNTFVTDNGISRDKFFASFRAVADGQYTPIFGIHEKQWFLDMLTSWTEFDEFTRLMSKHVLRKGTHK